jgi:DNA-directed RNA polymerase, sigma subunit (sigma70/sigma32)
MKPSRLHLGVCTVVALGLFTAGISNCALAQVGVFNQKPEELYPLLAVPQVQKELALTQTQLDKLQHRQEQIEALEEPKDANGDTRELTDEELPAVTAKQNALKQKALAEVLSTRQNTRLQQILAQLRGVSVLMEPSTLTELGVSDSQKKAMEEARKAAVEAMAPLREQLDDKRLTPRERARAADRLQAAQEGIIDKMVGALSDTQQKKWRDLIGPKFRLKIVRPVPSDDSPSPRPQG